MGDYTTFELDVTLKPETPEDVLTAIRLCISSDHPDKLSKDLFDTYSLFMCLRWKNMLDHWSAEIDGRCGGVLEGRRLRVISSLKAYDNELIKFLVFLSSHVESFVADNCRAWDNSRSIREDEAVPIRFPFDPENLWNQHKPAPDHFWNGFGGPRE